MSDRCRRSRRRTRPAPIPATTASTETFSTLAAQPARQRGGHRHAARRAAAGPRRSRGSSREGYILAGGLCDDRHTPRSSRRAIWCQNALEVRKTLRLTVLGKSPSWQDADGACSGYLHRRGRDDRAARLRQRRVLEAAPLPRLHEGRRGRDLASARGPLPRPGPVLLRAHLCAAPAADPGRPVARDRQTPARPKLYAPRGATELLPPGGRRVGQRGPDRERLRHRGVRRRTSELEIGSMRFRSRTCRTSPRRSRSTSPR